MEKLHQQKYFLYIRRVLPTSACQRSPLPISRQDRRPLVVVVLRNAGNVSDYTSHHVLWCSSHYYYSFSLNRYRGYFSGPTATPKYEHTAEYWNVFAARLAFVVVMEVRKLWHFYSVVYGFNTGQKCQILIFSLIPFIL